VHGVFKRPEVTQPAGARATPPARTTTT